jgi:diacylglycerol kinase (ATP)
MWLVAVNPTSGNGKGERVARQVSIFLHQREINYLEVTAPDAASLLRLLQEKITKFSQDLDGVIAVGGDGLAHLVLQAVVPARVAFAVVPAGTGNDFVRTLGWSLDQIEPLLQKVISSPAQEVDLGIVDNEWFGAILSTGFDSVVNERANALSWPKGPSRYNVAIALELAKFKPISYDIICDGHSITTEAMLVAIGNGKSYGGGMNICPQAQLHDGLFDVVLLEPVSKIEFLKVFPQVYSGSHISHPKVRTLRASKVSISANAVAYADGERIGAAPLSAECIKGAGLTWTL